MNLKNIGAMTLVALLVACASAGRPFDPTRAQDIQVGIHDQTQIRAWFGEPYQMELISGSPIGAVSRWTYVHAQASFGGLKSETHSLVIDFDAKGKVVDRAYFARK
ncbi:hypothetical protein [Sphaerotilus microaerophilus]|uniref:Lipoprotein SmpA/OmlA domain-containing protein n=1 Tax=Sphaerotilus microaerophilus TaxID=2914710 RepID=A0ABN6PF63_9BURK|nr:hypothetical protein [Sphaerotilus sp. FB-5]BDI03621.1 hypothetical protein CATMQ487_05910 [Sphaerotilus sp. FB-5]